MPFAQYHYPFENKELFEKKFFPADFICEGIDQTRGWFYTMHAIATMLFDNVAYKNLIVNELILDKTGQKMSKSKGNSVDPFALFEKYGADVTRWYLVTTSPPWRPTLFDEEGLIEVQRKFFGTLVNTYSFFILYANIDGFNFAEDPVPYEEREEIDKWIISKLNSLIIEYQEYMDNYDVTKAARAVSAFTIDNLSNWYVRRCRRRFWKSDMNKNKLAAYQTLYECLVTVCKLTSPFAPFISDELYKDMNSNTGREQYESVHLADFPSAGKVDNQLELRMEVAQSVVYLTRAMRAKSNLKVRQPLKKIMVVVDKDRRESLTRMAPVILEEVNIKELIVLEDDSEIVSKSAKANFKSLGPKFGQKVQLISKQIKGFNSEQIKMLEEGNSVKLTIDGEDFSIEREDVEIISSEIKGWFVESDGGVTVAIDIELDESLIAEGLAREFVNRIQNMRKDAGFEVIDKINIRYTGSNIINNAIQSFANYIAGEALADNIENSDKLNGGFKQDWQIGDQSCSIQIEKVSS
jgi:isoleucyl-tRNA synthetase